MDEMQEQLKAIFLEEASELLTNAEQAFLQLEGSTDSSSVIDLIFRLAHNLKGSSRAVGLDDVGEFTHQFESFILKIKQKTLMLSPQIVDVLLRCNDHLCQVVDDLKRQGPGVIDHVLQDELKAYCEGNIVLQTGPTGVGAADEISAVVTEIPNDVPSADTFPDLMPVEPAGPTESDINEFMTLPPMPSDASVGELVAVEDIAAEATEILMGVVATQAPTKQARTDEIKVPAKTAVQDESIRISVSRLEKLINNIGELVIMQTVLTEQKHTIESQLVQKTIGQLAKITKDIQDISMGLRLVPLKTTFQKMQRIVRDTSRALGKDINFVVSGEESELDKTVVEHLSDPLVHLVRNAVDHGIETKEERVTANKEPFGTVTLSAFHRGGQIVIEVRDDGKGLDPEKLRLKAIEKGILRRDQKISDDEARQLIFAPGFSTKVEVTDVSGRGVGMDVVKTNIEKVLHGKVELESELGSGSCMRIVLPLTLAIIDGMVVRINDERYIVPITHVHESLKPTEKDIHQVTGLGEVLSLRGENLPLYRLYQVVGKKGQMPKIIDSTAIVVRSGEQPFALAVDEIIGQQQVVIKQLGRELGTLNGISGGAILGDGRAALILDLNELISRAKAPAIEQRKRA